MHICFVTHEYPKTGFPHGGLGTFVQTFGKSLVAEGHQVSVVGINYTLEESFEKDEGVLVYRLQPSTIKGLGWFFNSRKLSRKISEIHKENPIDIVETPELGLAFLKKISKIKYIIRLHGGHHFFAEAENRSIDKWKGYQEKRSFGKADAFVAVSDYVKAHTAKYLSYNQKPIAVINYPVSVSKFFPADVSKQTPRSIVFAGTVCEKKGIRQLVQALPIVLEKFPETRLEIYGRDWQFPDKSSYIEFLKKQTPIEILEKITFHGAISHDQLPNAYEKAEVCVFPSHMETQGLVAPEAMLMQKAVVFSNLGPGPETIEHLKTGLLCDPHNPSDIAQKIIWTFENKDKSAAIGELARNAAMEKFDPVKILLKNMDFYQKLLA